MLSPEILYPDALANLLMTILLSYSMAVGPPTKHVHDPKQPNFKELPLDCFDLWEVGATPRSCAPKTPIEWSILSSKNNAVGWVGYIQ